MKSEWWNTLFFGQDFYLARPEQNKVRLAVAKAAKEMGFSKFGVECRICFV